MRECLRRGSEITAKGIPFKMASKDDYKDSTRDEWKQIKDEITCSICGELFKEPKTLPCLHTFCKECIQASLDTAERMKGQKTCPLCRSPVPKDGIASIPTNFATNRLIEIFKSRRTRDDNHAVKCDECDSEDGAVACMWCVECEKGLCEECYKPHTRSKSLKAHKTVTIDEFTKSPKAMLATAPKPQYCSTLGHDGQQLELYCHTCSQLICRDCTYTDHPRGEHQFEFLKKVIVSKQAKIKEISTPLQSLLDRVQVAIKNNETSKQEVDTRCHGNSDKVRSFFKDLHKILDAQEAKLLQNIDVIRSASHSSLDSQRKDLSSLEEQLNNCNVSVSGMIQSSNIDELLTYINWVDSRVTDLTSLVEQANLDSVCKGDSMVWCADHSVFTDHCQSLCNVSEPLNPPHCSVKAAPAYIPTSDPVVITVSLMGACGFPVTDQSQYLKVQSKIGQDFCCDVKVEELAHGHYHISYHPKERKDHSVTVTCNDTVLNSEEVNIPFCMRDYTAIQQEVLTIDKYGGRNFKNPWHIINGPDNELIVCDYNNQQVVVFNEQLQYSHVIQEGGCPSGVATDNMGHLYVASQYNNCVKKFNMDGSLITQFGTRGSAEGQFNSPSGLVISSKTGQLYVCDSENNRIQVFKNDKFVFSFGKLGSDPGDLNWPNCITMNNDETQLFVADTENHRVQVFTPDGNYASVFGQFTDIPYKLWSPYSIYYTPDDHLLVTSSTNVVLVVKSDGTFVTAIEGKGRFKSPGGVVMRSIGQIVVSGHSNCKLVVF